MTGDIELAGDGIFKCEEGEVGRRGVSIGAGCAPTDDLDNFSGGTGEVVEGVDAGAPGPNKGWLLEVSFVFGFGWARRVGGMGCGDVRKRD